MKKIILLSSLFFSLSFGAGTYDGFSFTDEEEKYALFFVNYYSSTDFTKIGLATADYTALAGLRPFANSTPAQISNSLLTIANNSNIASTDMKRLREVSHTISIPDHLQDINTSLGIKQSDANYLSALVGLLIGFAFAYFLIYTITNISRNKA